MSIGINELFQMLNWNNNEDKQQKGVEEAQNINYLSVFMQPIEDKGVWENCAKIITKKSDEILQPYLYDMFLWLQDENWPGFNIIYNRLTVMSAQFIKETYCYVINEAVKKEDEIWIINLSKLIENKDLYKFLSSEELEIIEKYTQINRD